MRFTLQTLLLCFVVFWSALAALGVGGLVVALLLLAVAAYARSARTLKAAVARFAAAAFVASVLFCCMWVWLVSPCYPRGFSAWSQCAINLKQIVLALHFYHDDYGCFPPAYIAGQDGRPMHSWRVLILPYIEQERLYKQYDFTQPWNGPNNRRLAARTNVPDVYRCPGDRSARNSAFTNYVAVVGPNTAWPGSRGRSLREITAGSSNTIMLVEMENSGIHWMEPKDLTLEEALKGINHPGHKGISSAHTWQSGYFLMERHAGANFAWVDGSVGWLQERLPAEQLARLLSVDEAPTTALPVSPDRWLRWDHIVGLAVLVVSYLILLLRPRQARPGQVPGERRPGGQMGQPPQLSGLST